MNTPANLHQVSKREGLPLEGQRPCDYSHVAHGEHRPVLHPSTGPGQLALSKKKDFSLLPWFLLVSGLGWTMHSLRMTSQLPKCLHLQSYPFFPPIKTDRPLWSINSLTHNFNFYCTCACLHLVLKQGAAKRRAPRRDL